MPYRFKTRGSIAAKAYALQKINNSILKWRSIVTTIGSPTHNLDSYSAKILNPVQVNTYFYIKNSRELKK